MYHIYSDVSGYYEEGNIKHLAYAFSIVQCEVFTRGSNTNVSRNPYKEGSGLIERGDVKTCAAGEIFASAMALKEIPKGSMVVVHSDLKDIKSLAVSNFKGGNNLKIAISILQDSAKDLDCQFTFDEKTFRSRLYHRCHSKAKSLAKSYGKDPKES